MPKPSSKGQQAEKQVVHPDVKVELCVGEWALTPDKAKELMGYTEDPKEAAEHGCYEPLYHSNRLKKDVYCYNNMHNRPLYMGRVEELIQEELNKRWQFNGEPIIIGQYGTVLNGQHQCVSLWEADAERQLNPTLWAEAWPGPVTIDKMILFGVEEKDEVINTMDTAKPRSLTDVIYRSEVFAKMKAGDRRVVARMLDSAIRLLWERTGQKIDAFAPRRTHSEAMDWVLRHPRILRCVKHVYEEYRGNGLKKPKKGEAAAEAKQASAKRWEVNNRMLGAGYAAALMYLMAAAETDYDAYHKQKVLTEKKINWSLWDKATEFWTRFSANDPTFKGLYEAIGYLRDPDTDGGGSLRDKVATIVKGWNVWVDGGEMKSRDLDLEDCYARNDAGYNVMVNVPVVGGIDVGKAVKNRDKDKGGDLDTEVDAPPVEYQEPTPEEIEAERKRINQEKLARKKQQGNGKGGKKAKQPAPVPDDDGHEEHHEEAE